jgi:hypothetical protein
MTLREIYKDDFRSRSAGRREARNIQQIGKKLASFTRARLRKGTNAHMEVNETPVVTDITYHFTVRNVRHLRGYMFDSVRASLPRTELVGERSVDSRDYMVQYVVARRHVTYKGLAAIALAWLVCVGMVAAALYMHVDARYDLKDCANRARAIYDTPSDDVVPDTAALLRDVREQIFSSGVTNPALTLILLEKYRQLRAMQTLGEPVGDAEVEAGAASLEEYIEGDTELLDIYRQTRFVRDGARLRLPNELPASGDGGRHTEL